MYKSLITTILISFYFQLQAQTWSKLNQPDAFHTGQIVEFDGKIFTSAPSSVGLLRESNYFGFLELAYTGISEKKYLQNGSMFEYNGELFANFFDVENGKSLVMKTNSSLNWTDATTSITSNGHVQLNCYKFGNLLLGSYTDSNNKKQWVQYKNYIWEPYSIPAEIEVSIANFYSNNNYEVIIGDYSLYIKRKNEQQYKRLYLNNPGTLLGLLNNKLYSYKIDYSTNKTSLEYYSLDKLIKLSETSTAPSSLADTLNNQGNYNIKGQSLYAFRNLESYRNGVLYKLDTTSYAKNAIYSGDLSDFYIKDEVIYISNSVGLYKSVNGSTFNKYNIFRQLTNVAIGNFISTDKEFYAIDTYNNVYKYNQGNFTLTQSTNRPTEYWGTVTKLSTNEYFLSYIPDSTKTKNNYTEDGGSTWKPLYINGKHYNGYFANIGDTVFLSTQAGLFKRINNSWTKLNSKYPGQIISLTKDLIGIYGNLQKINTATGTTTEIKQAFYANPIISTQDNLYAISFIDNQYGLYKSFDSGKTWHLHSTPPGQAIIYPRIHITSSGDILYNTTDDGFLTTSLNYGSSWNDANNGILLSQVPNEKVTIGLGLFNGLFFTSSFEGMYSINQNSLTLPYNLTISSSPSQIAPGQSVQIGIATTSNFASGNLISIFLSDSTGSFNNEILIGTAQLSTNGFVTCNIPLSLTKGSHYRVRAKSSDQNIIGAESFTNIKAISEGTLSVTLLRYSAQKAGNCGLIKWTTSAENQNNKFSLLKSTDGFNFYPLGTFPSKGDNSTYTFYDVNLSSGLNYYKLYQTDKDGSIKFLGSKVLDISLGNNGNISIYPNPIKSTFKIQIQELKGKLTSISLLDQSGSISSFYKKRLNEHGEAEYQLPQNISNGLYLIRIESGQTVKYLKATIIK